MCIMALFAIHGATIRGTLTSLNYTCLNEHLICNIKSTLDWLLPNKPQYVLLLRINRLLESATVIFELSTELSNK